MSSSSDDAEAVVALLLAYRKSQQERKYLWMRLWLSRRNLKKLLILRLCTIATLLYTTGDHIFKAYSVTSQGK
ncbi:hypothetical protein E2C01_093562 [Portunus trituberculatus]|uniref:Uncharacterized protein n=1 Tax=Portunus trituberculatus TaxID=210409 RepID=A0A5B7JV55_PORTR|nr:hypothetical protein [Portunus trituberculatus]